MPGLSRACAVLFLASLALGARARPPEYRTQGDCHGLPSVDLKVDARFCVGLAARGLGMPRGVLPLPGGELLVSDFGTWDRGRGRLLRLRPGAAGYAVEVLASHLNRPHGLQLGPDGLVYLGEDDRIVRFDPAAKAPQFEVVADGLPHSGRHPIKTFVFLADGGLLVNFGSASNNCESSRGAAVCPETRGPDAVGGLWRFWSEAGGWKREPYAAGLRNSVALAVDAKSGLAWVAENARDAINMARGSKEPDDDTPHDRLVQVRRGADYGWPYCYDAGLASPEFPSAACAAYDRPAALLPGHAAPLGMLFYRNDRLPAPWNDVLVMTYHGYRGNGHRIVAIPWGRQPDPAAAALTLVGDWALSEDSHPMGAPVDIKADAAGNLWVTEDRNGTLLRISPR